MNTPPPGPSLVSSYGTLARGLGKARGEVHANLIGCQHAAPQSECLTSRVGRFTFTVRKTTATHRTEKVTTVGTPNTMVTFAVLMTAFQNCSLSSRCRAAVIWGGFGTDLTKLTALLPEVLCAAKIGGLGLGSRLDTTCVSPPATPRPKGVPAHLLLKVPLPGVVLDQLHGGEQLLRGEWGVFGGVRGYERVHPRGQARRQRWGQSLRPHTVNPKPAP